jgi:hypothetical protein
VLLSWLMKKSWFLLIASVLALVLIGLLVKKFILGREKLGALSVSSTPRATVFVDDIQVGITPYFEDKVRSGEHTIRLVPESADNLTPWESQVLVAPNVLTVVNRVLGSNEASSSGEVLSLEKIPSRKNAALTVVSVPNNAVVKVNGEAKGFSPVSVDELEPGEYQITVAAAGYEERTISANTVVGYKLTVNVQLTQKIEGFEEATPSGQLTTGTPTPETTATPTPKGSPKPSQTPPPKPYIKVKATPTGFLRVRSEPSTTAEELAKLEPDQMVPYLNEEKNGWYKVEYEEGKEGWVSGVYAELVE